jgi:hypothetical protein
MSLVFAYLYAGKEFHFLCINYVIVHLSRIQDIDADIDG